jgi:hypothetical protein
MRTAAVIKKVKGGYQVVSSMGRNLGGPYKTLELARDGRMRKTLRKASGCKPRRRHARVLLGSRVPKTMEEKCWHNWLIEENYL